MKRRVIACLVLVVLTACRRNAPATFGRQTSASFSEPSRDAISALGYAAKAVPAATAAAAGMAPPQQGAADRAPAQRDLKLIFTADLQIEVPDFKAAVEEATKAVTAMGGYVSNRQSNEGEGGGTSGQITLRIPTERFEGAMSTLKKLGKVRHEAVGTQDVTKEYADIETRLKVKRETAARLRDILANRTGKLSEVLEVEREIGRVVEEIERAEGEKRYFDNLVSLSTITLSLAEPASIVTPGALDPLIYAFRNAARVMSESMAALIELVSGGLPWILAFYAVYRLIRWRFRRAR